MAGSHWGLARDVILIGCWFPSISDKRLFGKFSLWPLPEQSTDELQLFCKLSLPCYRHVQAEEVIP